MNSRIILNLFIAFLLTACSGQNKDATQNNAGDNTAIATEVENTPPMSGWKCHGLQGRVKSVKYADGAYLEFNKDGNLTKRIKVSAYGKQSEERLYKNPTMYILNSVYEEGTMYEISYKGDTRIEKQHTNTNEEHGDTYVFDKKGRLTNYELSEMSIYSEEYSYTSESERFPNMQSMSGGDETVTFLIVSNYEYLKTDNRGNWTERKVNRKISETDEEEKENVKTEALVEKREITYF